MFGQPQPCQLNHRSRLFTYIQLCIPFGCNFCSARGTTPEQLGFPTAAALRSDFQYKVQQGEPSEPSYTDARINGGRLEKSLI